MESREHFPASLTHTNIFSSWSIKTHSEVEPREVFIIVLLQPVVEVLGVICWVSFTICGHAEYGKGVLDFRQTGQFPLFTRKNNKNEKPLNSGCLKAKRKQLPLSQRPTQVLMSVMTLLWCQMFKMQN